MGSLLLRFVALLVALAMGAALGLAATLGALGHGPPFGAVRSGPWTAWPESGTPAADPYARAAFARDGEIPLAAAGGLRFLARVDDAGRPLDGRCAYDLAGPMPPAQYWTVTVLDPDGRPRSGPDPRAGFTSQELVRGADGGIAIMLARQARPGNWLPTHGDGAFLVMLSLYETPLGKAIASGGQAPTLPSLTRTACP